MKIFYILLFLLSSDLYAEFSLISRVSLPRGVKILKKLNVGDEISNASLINGVPQFSSSVVQYKKQTSPGTLMMTIHFDRTGNIVTSPRSLFVRMDGTLVRAENLYIGSVVMKDDGTPLEIVKKVQYIFYGETGNVSVSYPYNGTSEGHLISLDGVLVGDNYLESDDRH